MRASRILLFLLVAGALGLTVFGLMVWNATTIEPADATEALRELTEARAAFDAATPMLVRSATGELTRSDRRADPDAERPTQLRVLAYRSRTRRLVRADVPFWFLELKGPAAELILSDTDFDLEQLGVTPDDLARHGPGIVLDEARANGDHLLVWLE